MTRRIPDFVTLVEAVLDNYGLEWNGIHGIGHWGRVVENGWALSQETGCDRDVITLFAVFHDSRRFNDGHDPEHGLRGARLAKSLRGKLFEIDDAAFELLKFACIHHTSGLTEGELTVQCCWDADRLDLGRVGTVPDPRYLCTDVAKSHKMRQWADGRGQMEFIPEAVRELWDRLGELEPPPAGARPS